MNVSYQYLIRRVLQFVPAVIFVVFLTYLFIYLAPGDPVTILAGEAGADPEYYQMIRERLGLDRPFHVYLDTRQRSSISRSMMILWSTPGEYSTT